MELIARGAHKGGFRYWFKSLLDGVLVPVYNPAEDRDAPAVVACTERGDEVLQRTGTYGQALRARDRFQRELDQLGEAEFRRRYGLPQPPGTEQ
jgi:hypothetical protein